MKLFGWTLEQWAIVLAQFPAKDPSNFRDLLESRKAWLLSRSYEPGSEKLSTPERDFSQVEKMLRLVERLYSPDYVCMSEVA